jgi:hypothetical protein
MINNNNKVRKYYNLPSIIYRAKHDDDHSFNMQSADLYEDLKGKGLELLIMCLLLSNKGNAGNPTDSDWVVVKEEIRLRTGMAVKRFNKAWNALKEMGYIENVGTRTRARWVIWENKKPLRSPMDQIITVTGDTLTSIKETIISEKEYSKEFLELWAAYPTEGNHKDGTTYPLKCNKIKCQQAYSDYLNQGSMTHKEVMTALEVESTDKQKQYRTYFRKGLLSWIRDKSFEDYRGKTLEPIDLGYGNELN